MWFFAEEAVVPEWDGGWVASGDTCWARLLCFGGLNEAMVVANKEGGCSRMKSLYSELHNKQK